MTMHVKRKEWSFFGILAALALTATVMVAQQAVPAVNKPTVPNAAAPVVSKPVIGETEEAVTPKKPSGEGIRVHGHWILQVKNADGTLGERREFENSLVTDDTALSGNQILVLLLSGNAVPSDPAVVLGSGSISGAGEVASDACGFHSALQCYAITTSQSTASGLESGNYAATQLGLSISTSLNAGITLTGSLTVPAGVSSFNFVETDWPLCMNVNLFAWQTLAGGIGSDVMIANPSGSGDEVMPPSVCNNTLKDTSPWRDAQSNGALTSTTISGGPLAVVQGQTVMVTVVLSFS